MFYSPVTMTSGGSQIITFLNVDRPEPRKDHAIVMARFARDCLRNLRGLLEQLEEKLVRILVAQLTSKQFFAV